MKKLNFKKRISSRGKGKSRNERRIDSNLQREQQKIGWKGRFEGAVACKNVAMRKALQVMGDRSTWIEALATVG